jgi:XFP N-terminal domain
MHADTLAPELLHNIDACWRAANDLSVGQIYLFENPLLKWPLALTDGRERPHLETAAQGEAARTQTLHRQEWPGSAGDQELAIVRVAPLASRETR